MRDTTTGGVIISLPVRKESRYGAPAPRPLKTTKVTRCINLDRLSMYRVALFDPATLAVQFNLAAFKSRPSPHSIQDFAHHVIGSSSEEMMVEFAKLNSQTQGEAIVLAAAYWHEQRHFFDSLLTNYGALRTRNFLVTYANISEIIGALNDAAMPIALPVSAFIERPRFGALGIKGEAPASVRQIAISLAERHAYLHDEDKSIATASGPLLFGGRAQLEYLAWMAQIAVTERFFGIEQSLRAQPETEPGY